MKQPEGAPDARALNRDRNLSRAAEALKEIREALILAEDLLIDSSKQQVVKDRVAAYRDAIAAVKKAIWLPDSQFTLIDNLSCGLAEAEHCREELVQALARAEAAEARASELKSERDNLARKIDSLYSLACEFLPEHPEALSEQIDQAYVAAAPFLPPEGGDA